ncbi:hypothetical protein [Candidatus Poriferisocius sp.]|uniref:hypothetical protein n=1 Tax=Candidatus Poriferisocius sp. TaxID=3101276 RepID=UPI003B02E97D
MLVTCWSTKGGSGTTVIAALISLHAAQDRNRPVLLIDLCGDLAAVFGCAEASSGLGEWLRSDLAPCSLDRVLEELTPNLSLLCRGHGLLSALRADDLVEWLATDAIVVVDAGVLRPSGEPSDRGSGDDELRWRLAAEADRSVLVTRACYLALRRAVSPPVRPSGVVLVAEAGRALTRSDCERAIGAPVLATVAVDPDIARAVDAGMLRTRVPKGAIRALSRLTEEV